MELRLTADRFRAVFDIAPLGVAIADRLGRLLEANPAFLTLFGYSLHEAQERTLIDLAHPEDRNRIAGLIQGIRNGQADTYETEKRCVRKDGREFWAADRCAALRDGKGGITHWLSILEDISARRDAEQERRRLTAQVQQAQKMELAMPRRASALQCEFSGSSVKIVGEFWLG